MVHSVRRLISILFIADVAVPSADFFFGDQSWRFDPDNQVNLSAVLVGLQLFFAAVVMLGIYTRERRESTASVHGTWLWLLLTIAFMVLAVNAIFRLPEILPTQQWASPNTIWLLLLPYPVVLAPFALLVGLSVVWLTLSRFGDHPSWSRGIAAAIIFWFLAMVLGCSLKLGLMPPGGYPVGWTLQQFLTLLGITLYLWGVTQYARHLRASLAVSKTAQPRGRLLLRSIAIIASVTLLGSLVSMLLATSNPAYLYRYNGNFFAKHDNYNRAATAFNRSLDKEPNNLKSLCGLANAYLNADSPQKAITVCDQILGIDNESLFALNLKATLLAKSGRYAAAEKCLRRASTLEPRDANL
ncbi:MAG: tetratricopeptide repeat protein, partial [Pirellulales bacterium]|nr:tetratricopeptide repeat protein [Pirellulales bacterium]